MARNPYEPPGAPVSKPGRRGEPPKQVMWAVWMMRASLVIGYLSLFLVDNLTVALGDADNESSGTAMALFFIMLALMAVVYLWLIQCVKDGRNWARILMLVLTVLGVLSMFAGTGGDEASMIADVITVADTIIDVLAIVLLFRAPASDWFATKR